MHAWEQFLDELDHELGVETVNKWLRSLKVVRFDAANLYLEAQDPFQAMWYEEHVKKRVLKSFCNNNNRKIKVHVAVANLPEKKKSKKPKISEESPQEAKNSFKITFDTLDPYSTFDSYQPFESNHIAFQVVAQMAGLPLEEKGTSITEIGNFNPIYIYGGVGTGKTHLLMAVADKLSKDGQNVLYCGAQTFTDHVVAAIRAGEMGVFRESYRNNDVLLVDDVHLFSRKGATQEEFFHTFNTLHLSGKKIIMSANCSPKQLTYIEPRLVSRFEWGIVLPLDIPTKEETRTLLTAKCQAMGFILHEKVINFLADTFTTAKGSVKALEAIILRVHLDTRLGRIASKNLTISHVETLIADLIKEEKEHALTYQGIIVHVAHHFSLDQGEIIGKSQRRDLALPRQLSMYFCRTLLKMPFVAIGDVFSRDHSTVMSSIKNIEKGIAEGNNEITYHLRSLTNDMYQKAS